MDGKVLPDGWRREEVSRRNGLTTGKTDVYYYSPDGTKFRSKPQLAKYLGNAVDLTSFDYRTGKTNTLLMRKNRNTEENIKGMKNNDLFSLPVRRTVGLRKQPVTIIKTQRDSKAKHDLKHDSKHDLKHGPLDKPRQLFWEKRLEGLRATSDDTDLFENFDLPKNMRPVGPNVGNDTAVRSVATAFHFHVKPITGQTAGRNAFEKNPVIYLDPRQPLIGAITITEDEVKRQEERVNSIRRKVSIAVNEYEKSLESMRT